MKRPVSHARSAALLTVALSALVLVLAGCRGGSTVDRGSPSFVDQTSPPGFDKESPPSPAQTPSLPSAPSQPMDSVASPGQATGTTPVIRNESGADFVEPPAYNRSLNALTLDEKTAFVGKDAVKLYIWNERGSQRLLMPEGTSASLPELKVSVTLSVVSAADGGKALFLINGAQADVLGERQETHVGETWIFVTDIFLNEAGETPPR